MRATLPLLALFTALPTALAAGRCRESLNYCGSTLLSLGWTQNELLAIADGDANIEKALFYCEMDGIIEYSGPCTVCQKAPEGQSDACDEGQAR
ncbi:hypothetical protein BDV38DRAFT_286149 [Aspergillus pseudotamarii]|uniref:Uncharacterized protein n=1 Tax=Aspergillus pseudotamarii TaxID=132259 RepID=A0A5N6SLW2_ASPPS|nr:uncharacterized protein BDV38DRAFT_286149 [Aspergillus pseudotamarii]KAE8134124.1 hypothetical protein BDV38DRAFT_286149 [Aspergillus pseudotamarii]